LLCVLVCALDAQHREEVLCFLNFLYGVATDIRT
jgi:hypothetical protein